MREVREISNGDRFGNVVVKGRVYNVDRREWEYECKCVCGNEFVCRKDHLKGERRGCAKCMGKGKIRVVEKNLMSEQDFNDALERRIQNIAKVKAENEAIKEAIKVEKKKAREQELMARELEKKNKRDMYEKTKHIHPCWIGEKFNRLTVIDSYKVGKDTFWVCECDCGNIIERKAKQVKNNQVMSCGCISREISQNSVYKERLHSIWSGMKYRCLNKNSRNWKNYGGRGIKICNDWLEYKNFREWAYKNGWTENSPKIQKYALSIERKNVNGDYEPSNCCFIEMRFQCLNKRPYNECNKKKTKKDLTIIKIGNEQKSLREWQEFYGISNNLLRYRNKILNLSIEESLTTPKYDKSVLYKAQR